MGSVLQAAWAAELLASILGIITSILFLAEKGKRPFTCIFASATIFVLLYRFAPTSAASSNTSAQPAASTTLHGAAADYESAKQSFVDHRFDVALGKARSYVQECPGDKEGHRLLGACYGAVSQWEGAAMEYQTVVKADGHDMDGEMGLATALEQLNDHNGAVQAYRTIISCPDSTSTYRERAQRHLAVLGE